jgi:hypothetical protein
MDKGGNEPQAVPDPAQEEAFEARFEAAPAVVVVIALQLVVTLVGSTGNWTLWVFPWWVMLAVITPEAALLASLASNRLSQRLDLFGHRTAVTVALFGLISFANAVLLLALIGSLISGD